MEEIKGIYVEKIKDLEPMKVTRPAKPEPKPADAPVARPCRPRPCGCHGLTHHAPKHKQIQTITNTGIRGLQQCYKHSGCVCHTIIEQIDITVRVCEGLTHSVRGLTHSVRGLTHSVSGLTLSVSGLTHSVSGLTHSTHMTH